MQKLIRAETAHTIDGVKGRLLALYVPPAPWKAGTFGNQKWVSESRPIQGWGEGARITVRIRFDDECRNGHNTFSITAEIGIPGEGDSESFGRLHDDITQVFPELAHLIKWHLVSADGPMHYLANTCYHVGQRSLEYARNSAVWPDATDEELCLPREVLESTLRDRLPPLMVDFRAQMESIGFVWGTNR